MPRACRICVTGEVKNDVPATFDICWSCAKTFGVIPMPGPRRPARPCNRCSGVRFVRVIPRELTATGGDYVHEKAAPMCVTIVPLIKDDPWWKATKHPQNPNPHNGRGLLETYVCVGCGFVEWYCVDPESIPIGPEYMSDIVDYTPTTPYR